MEEGERIEKCNCVLTTNRGITLVVIMIIITIRVNSDRLRLLCTAYGPPKMLGYVH